MGNGLRHSQHAETFNMRFDVLIKRMNFERENDVIKIVRCLSQLKIHGK